MPINALKASWEVRAGLIPGEPRREFTRRWEYTSQQHAADQGESDLTYHSRFAKLRAEAMDYYLQVSLPQINNWATLEFLWY